MICACLVPARMATGFGVSLASVVGAGSASSCGFALRAVATALERDESAPDGRGAALRTRAETAYRWEDVIDGYAVLCEKLVRR